ncbi:MAG TPA: hypothetical protein VLN08_03530, partial [Vicinamibacterales bacterium]|nr:hypothetical protein [Vicinamibacterales bacterium]
MLPRADRSSARTLVVVLAVVAFAWPASAQQPTGGVPAAVTEADYARAEKFLAPAVSPLVVGGSVSPTWLPDDRFTYRSTTAEGVQFLLVDPVKATKAPAFD